MNPVQSASTCKSDAALQLTAYEITANERMTLRAASIFRTWMDATPSRFAYRCLPLTIANQLGWVISCPASFTVRWDGGDDARSLLIVHDIVPPDPMISSLFGCGVVTFNMPCLFRTPNGINLWVKGPSNSPKDGVQPLEGIVESDWSSSTFTMNWKITRPNHLIRFERGEPVCMIVPVQRGLAESLNPVSMPITSAPEINAAFRKWSQERDEFHKRIAAGDPDATNSGWQKDYFLGRDPGTPSFMEHQTRLAIKEFRSSGESPMEPSDH